MPLQVIREYDSEIALRSSPLELHKPPGGGVHHAVGRPWVVASNVHNLAFVRVQVESIQHSPVCDLVQRSLEQCRRIWACMWCNQLTIVRKQQPATFYIVQEIIDKAYEQCWSED